MTQAEPFLFSVYTRELDAIMDALRGGYRLVQVCGPSGAGKSEILPIVTRASPTRTPVVLDMRLPLDPSVRLALLDQMDPGGRGRSMLREDPSVLEFFCKHSVTLLLLDHPEVAREQVADLLPALVRASASFTAIVSCTEPFPWPESAVIQLAPLEVPASPGDPRWRLLLDSCSPEQRTRWLTRPQELGLLWVRLGGIFKNLRLAAPAVAALGPEEVLARLEIGKPEALLALAWSFLAEEERDALGLLAVFAGGCCVDAFVSCGREVTLLHRLARGGWLRRLLSTGSPRWALQPEVLVWISSRASFALRAEHHCAEHMHCMMQRRMVLDRRHQIGQEQRNFWINVLRLEESPLSFRENAVLLGWMLDGLLCSHGSFPLTPEDQSRVDVQVDRLAREETFSALNDLGSILLLHRVEMLFLSGQHRRALALLAPLEKIPQLESAAVFLRLRFLLDQAEIEPIVPTLVRLWERHSGDPVAERNMLPQLIALLSQLGEVELVQEGLARLLHLHANSGEQPDTLLDLRAHALSLGGDIAAISEQEQAFASRADLHVMRDPSLWQFLIFAALIRGDTPTAQARLKVAKQIPTSAASVGFLLQFLGMDGLIALLEDRAVDCRTSLEELLQRLPGRERLARSLFLGALALCEAREGDLARSEERLRELNDCARHLRASREIASIFTAAARRARGEHEEEIVSEGSCMAPVLMARRLLLWQREECLRQQREVMMARDGSWWQGGDGLRVSLSNRPVLLALMGALCEARRARPGEALDKETLVRSAWPAERRPEGPAATNRLHVALATLRKQGLAEVLRSTREGWFLEPELTRLRDP